MRARARCAALRSAAEIMLSGRPNRCRSRDRLSHTVGHGVKGLGHAILCYSFEMVQFTVLGKPVSVNAAYKRRNLAGGGKGLMLSEEARIFKASVAAHALVARQRGHWPALAAVGAVKLTIVTWNARHDADAPVKLLGDALEGILYVRDSVVRSVTASRAKDGGRPRIEVTVEALDGRPSVV